MKSSLHQIKYWCIVLVMTCSWAQCLTGQSSQTNGRIEAPADNRNARALYDEANSYIEKKYEDFNRRNIAFDPKIEATVLQEQRDLAARNAVLASKSAFAGDDLYYVGLLYHLANDSDAALLWLRRFLAKTPTGTLSQTARSAIVVHALRKDLLAEAEHALEEYTNHQPQDQQELFAMQQLIVNSLSKQKAYSRMAFHAEAMLKTAKLVAASGTEPLKQAEMIFEAGLLLSEARTGLGKKELAIETMEDLRRFSMSLPSGYLYKLALNELKALDPGSDLSKAFEGPVPATGNIAPELVDVSNWLDQTPGKLADFRGKVVLLDFWATWCVPCRFAFPKLRAWHLKYQNDGLVIIGLTNYYGQIEGQALTQKQELDYIRDFKTKNNLPYGFTIATSRQNETNYSVESIPMSFLIDRKGRMRFITSGPGEEQSAALAKMIKKLLDEPVARASCP